jgi:energy-coupling factor transporter ATP-binding protein EcfA2
VGRGKPERGPVSGPPGSGKSTFIKALKNIAEGRNIKLLVIRAKECAAEEFFEVDVPEEFIVKKISTILQFTSSGESFKPAFDVLATYNCSSINCLLEHVEKEMRQDIAMWIRARLKLLSSFINGKVKVPVCLSIFDEPVKRIVAGLLYAIREKITMPIILDDTLSFVLNDAYRQAFVAMMRPFKVSVNERLDTRQLLSYNPIVITPGGNEIYRLARPEKYVVIFDHQHWELSRREVEKIVYS